MKYCSEQEKNFSIMVILILIMSKFGFKDKENLIKLVVGVVVKKQAFHH
jgi:hypothetical protein